MHLLRHTLRPTSCGWGSIQTPFSIEVRRYSSKKVSKPLRILFCGSDSFSSTTLRALYEEKKSDPEGILSLDVLCRPGKRVGRSLKVFRDGEFMYLSYALSGQANFLVPIKGVATELGLTVHERDTFTGWDVGCLFSLISNMCLTTSTATQAKWRIHKSHHRSLFWTIRATTYSERCRVWRTKCPSFAFAKVCSTQNVP